LSYTTFAYSALEVTRDGVRFRLRNTGARAGREVAQLYVRDHLASVVRPVLQLAGAAAVLLAPGEERLVTIPLDPDALTLIDRDLRRVVEPGTFVVYVGASSADLRLRGELRVP
jgi:beta-glucosidase